MKALLRQMDSLNFIIIKSQEFHSILLKLVQMLVKATDFKLLIICKSFKKALKSESGG